MNILKRHYLVLLLVIPLFLGSVTVVFASIGVVENTLWSIVVGLFGRMMGWGGSLLNWGVTDYVVGFGKNFLDTGVGFAVDTLWVTVRDLFNLTFIFGLVYIGFKMILNSDDSNTKKWLINLLLAAILINFSLYITKFIVDLSNITATQIASGFIIPGTDEIDVSGSFMNKLSLQSVTGDSTTLPKAAKDAPYGYIFGSAFLFIIAAFVFGAGGILLMIRYAVLCLYMIFSPLMFIGWVFPGLQSLTSKYWSGFLGRAFFAPIYLLLLYFSLTIISRMFASNGDADYAKVLGGDGKDVSTGFSNTLPPFIIAMVFLIASIVIANKLGADGAGKAVSIGKSLAGSARRGATRAAGAASVGVAARVGRNTVGRAANTLTNNKKFQDYAAKHAHGRKMYAAADKTAKSSFDARRVAGLGQATGLGTGAAGGYAKTVADKKKADDDFLKAIGTNDIHNEDGTVKDEFAEGIATDINNDEDVKAALKNRDDAKTEYDPAAAKQATVDAENALKAVEELKANEKEPLNEKLRTLGKNYDSETNEQEKAAIQKEMDETRKRVADVDTRFEGQLKQASQHVTDTKAKLEKATSELAKAEKVVQQSMQAATAEAEAKATYSRQLDYIDQLEKTGNWWKKPAAVLTGAVGGATAGVLGAGALGVGAAATGGLLAFGELGAAATVHAQGDRAHQSAAALRKKYGRNAIKMAKRDKKKKEYELRAEVEKDYLDKEDTSEAKSEKTADKEETT